MKLRYIGFCVLLSLGMVICNDSMGQETNPFSPSVLENLQNNVEPVMRGATYEERSQSLIQRMLQAKLAKEDNIKYLSPFYYVRLW